MQIESFSTQPLQQPILSYLYLEYNDDPTLQAFVDAYNSLAQGYLDWFNSTPLSVYTLPAISGPLLDWVGNGLYGISRPVISTLTTGTMGAYNSKPFNTIPYNSRKVISSGTAQTANDDIYKRVMTWILYLGDGKQTTITWLKKRIARFLWGANGTDISLDLIQNIDISVTQGASPSFTISVPIGPMSTIMNNFIAQGILPMPLQIAYTISLGIPLTIGGDTATIGGDTAVF
jgi:hypothetical protein